MTPRVYVSGHRNPDTDSIAAAVGYAELLNRLDPSGDYVPVRLGDVNAQTRWALDRSGAAEPDFMAHILLRARDVMQTEFATSRDDEPLRSAGLEMARAGSDVVPVVDSDGVLVGVVTERALARRYIRESRETSSLVDTPTRVSVIADLLEGRVISGGDSEVAGRVWVFARAATASSGIGPGDVVVVGDRADAQRVALELGAALLVISNGTEPAPDITELAAEKSAALIVSPLDSYVTGRMITLAAPCRSAMDAEPLTVRPDDVISDVADAVKNIHYRAAVAVDTAGRPVGLVTRSDLVNPQRRRVILVDHAEFSQSVPGIEEAEIVEILDHHHIGSVETNVPVRALFDPVGSTATLVVERFRQNGMEPTQPTGTLLLAAVLSDTVILNSPTTTDRDRDVVAYFERALGVDALAFGREMFEQTADVDDVPAEELVSRDAKYYEASDGGTVCIAQIETVGSGVLERTDELRKAICAIRERRGYVTFILMVTDILAKGTSLLLCGEERRIEQALGRAADGNGVIELPGVMSRKKQLAPQLLPLF